MWRSESKTFLVASFKYISDLRINLIFCSIVLPQRRLMWWMIKLTVNILGKYDCVNSVNRTGNLVLGFVVTGMKIELNLLISWLCRTIGETKCREVAHTVTVKTLQESYSRYQSMHSTSTSCIGVCTSMPCNRVCSWQYIRFFYPVFFVTLNVPNIFSG